MSSETTSMPVHQESQAPQPSQATTSDDEISLIDLAKLLVRRWKAMAGIFTAVVLMALAYALLQTPTYTYTSIYQVAERGTGEPFESPTSLVSRTQSLYLGTATRELMASEGVDDLDFETQVSHPDNTEIVKLTSTAPETLAERVEAHHRLLLDKIVEGQQARVERRRQALESQLANVENTLAHSSDGASERIASTLSRKFELEAELEGLTAGETGQTAVQSLKQQGTSRALILALGVVLGGMLAVMGVFLLHFVSLVRESLNEDAG
ncbi:Wzz/FepE/Etk N-terminal domain-containing protein [Halomonas sp. ND22Bw]|uniref:Wzz/FepE/Etk N-terminal domain-containing protein n=1 Tax=Halomonas sp. ND22Bw TaxID=2054178 RepID=UPI0034E09D47